MVRIYISQLVARVKQLLSASQLNLLRLLDFLSILDDSGCVSITNVALIALVTKMVLADKLDWPSVVSVITVMANYAHKRAIIASQPKGSSDDQSRPISSRPSN